MPTIKIKQHDIKDCGAACLASVGNYHNINLPIARIRQYANTDKRGTNVLGIIEAAEKMGLLAKGVKGSEDSLDKIPLPSIAHIIVKQQLHHYVVIYTVKKNKIEVMDPAFGTMKTYSTAEFKEVWTGVLILFAKNDNFKSYTEKTSPSKRFWNLIQPHKSILSQALLGAILFTVLGLAMSIYI